MSEPQQTDSRAGTVAVIGAGVAGLITAYTLLRDGFDVQILTRDSEVGGVWSSGRIYPGLYLNNVYGEYRFSSLELPLQESEHTPDGRLTGPYVSRYMNEFASRFLQGKIRFGADVRNARVAPSGSGWLLDIHDDKTSTQETEQYARIVLCTGGCITPYVPATLTPSAAALAGFDGVVFHTSDFCTSMDDLLASVPPADQNAESAPLPIVVIGGGKSAQDVCAYLANEGRRVTMVAPELNSFLASSKRLPDSLRRNRLLSLMSPHIHLRTALERFMHTTWLGKKMVEYVWRDLEERSFQAAGIPAGSPLRNTVPPFWHTCVNDEGVPSANGFQALAVAGKIEVVCPARVNEYGKDGNSVVLEDGRGIPASAVVLATGYKSSWPDIFDEKTLEDVGLAPQPAETDSPHRWDYPTLSFNPPPLHPEAKRWSTMLYRGIVPAKRIDCRDFAVNGAFISANQGYTLEVTSHWVSAYFRGDEMRIPRTVADALAATQREAAWLRARYPGIPTALNGSLTSYLAFWSWPQHADDLLEDMGLQTMRSGGNALTWPFKVVNASELRGLKEERDALREAARRKKT